jgi:UDP-2,4-diacetamido-2,4,6-trideoxy-beta-L-altropyranose hydrolase
MNVAFRVDASPAIGTGHFMRCLSLADGLVRSGAHVRFMSRPLPDGLRAMLTDRSLDFAPLAFTGDRVVPDGPAPWPDAAQAADAEAASTALSLLPWDWLVVDHYGLDERWERSMRRSAARLLVIDDLADRRHDCDVLLDQNAYPVEGQRYAALVPSACLMLEGPRYALLRDEFAHARERASPRTGSVRRVLVSFGGVDAENHTSVAIEALLNCEGGFDVDVVVGAHHSWLADIQLRCDRAGFACHVQTNRMAELMAVADLAIGAGGITTWERCCMGLPSLVTSIAANQDGVIEGAAQLGLVYAPGGPVTPSSLAIQLQELLDNVRLREMMSRNGMQVVDGRGVDRVVRVIDQASVAMREAQDGDARALFEWRNHESVRNMSRRSDPISWTDHQAWFSAVLEDPNQVLLIGERDGCPVGVVRFDVHGDQGEVSIYRVPGSDQKTRGVSLLLAAEARFRAMRPAVAALTAEVLDGNHASHRLFRSTGYERHSAVYRKQLHRS